MIMAASAVESGPQLRPGSPHSPSIIVENIFTNIIVENIIVANIFVNIDANLIIVNIMSKSCRTVPPSSIRLVITIFNQVLLVILIMIVMMF